MPSSCPLGLNGSGLPDHEALFRQPHRPIEKQRERAEQQDPCDHGIHIEEALRLMDEVADAFCRAQIFADHCSDERKPHRVVQAREHPAHRARHINMRRSWRGLAPSMRALASTTGLTSRTPWQTLKNTIKNTSVTPRATLEAIPRPNHTKKIGARITRGMALIALM